ncbi:uncharacterized protein LOC124374084 [Homalodisca vitripennis]|uniref:uncharacterized protein LOC124374084 n=1 Tax=Homalodisca vitripennis TaxID=197043 RepID=UPI001EE9F69D|nr:uncharacterized protein LOC124374084 [Homalodisca vitripennis]
MSDRPRYERSERLRPYSSRFEDFVDNELNGDVSDLEISDDEDADPDFEPEEPIQQAQEETSEDDSDSEGGVTQVVANPAIEPSTRMVQPRGSRRSSVTSVNQLGTHTQVTTPEQNDENLPSQTRTFWKKQVSFDPLPPAPAYEEINQNALNIPPQYYVSKYNPDDIFNVVTNQTNRTYIENKGRPLISGPKQTKRFFGAAIKNVDYGSPTN